jgi:hypothetical protein
MDAVSKEAGPAGIDPMTCPDSVSQRIYKALEAKLRSITEGVACRGVPRHSVTRTAAEEWGTYLEGLGAVRIGILMGVCTEAEAGKTRVDDPMIENGSRGMVEMTREVADKIATLGLP